MERNTANSVRKDEQQIANLPKQNRTETLGSVWIVSSTMRDRRARAWRELLRRQKK